MSGINKVILVGRLGADPEVRYTSAGVPVTTFRIATSENWINKEGKKEERTEWHRVVAWRKLGEICGEYLAKGKQVYIEGKLRTRSWEDRDGHKRWVTEVVAFNMVMLGTAPEATAEGEPLLEQRLEEETGEVAEEDIPF